MTSRNDWSRRVTHFIVHILQTLVKTLFNFIKNGGPIYNSGIIYSLFSQALLFNHDGRVKTAIYVVVGRKRQCAVHQPQNISTSDYCNCGAIAEKVLESKQFEHKTGAFTGTTARQIGLFEQAGKSTFFVDEIAELPCECRSGETAAHPTGVSHKIS